MASIDLIRASNGSGNASAATVQSIRSPAATTLDVDTVQGINDTFCATMGTPHTFTDPVTSETITVISEATAVDFTGHVDGSNLEIDTIAPGYTDNGSAVGDIIIIRPTTQWSDNVADVLGVSLNDDGTLKAVTENPGYTALAYTPNTVVANGNRSYTLTFNSVDLTGYLSAGMRLRTTRTSAAPTQCADLESSSSHYFSRASASVGAITFTDDFVVSAWIKLESYAAMSIASRFNGTSGWRFIINSSGQLTLQGFNAGGSNLSYVISYQSVPLNKWVHVAAQLDMSTFTATTTTSYIMIDGVDVPASVARGGTNPTALVQAGNLEIGSNNAAEFFDGKIAQVALYSAKVTQANIRATISQGLTGSETSLLVGYSFNGVVTDLSSNAYTLTANNSAVATNADSPFGGQADGTISSTLDYAIITKTAFSTNTTLTVQVPEGCTIPTTGGVSAVSYSTQKVPYLFPAQRGKWRVYTLVKANAIQSSPTGTTWYNLGPTSGTSGGHQLNVPVGDWRLGYEASTYAGRSGSSDGLGIQTTLSTANNSETDPDMTSRVYMSVASAVSGSVNGTVKREKDYTLSASAIYYMNNRVGTVGAAADIQTNVSGVSGDTVIYGDNAYL